MTKPRVLLCSLDGVRPDALQLTDTPCIDRLAAAGAVTWSARTVMPSSTLPCHTSMLRGVDTPRHGITTNTFHPLVRPVPSLIETAFDHGKLTGFVYNWEELRDLSDPGKLHVSLMDKDCYSASGDVRVAEMACLALERYDLDLLFVYFGWPDECAHRAGWMSQPYLDAIANADSCLARVLGKIEELGRLENTTILVTSDHGGHERTHGTDCDEDMTVPWILSGAGVRPGHQIAGPVRIYDTCPPSPPCSASHPPNPGTAASSPRHLAT
jgi:predicted AlkP superfamily pyrophosphatase or phosphodiesterase